MNLQQLKYVLAIYKEGSITKASHALFCAQPNVSSALKSLEKMCIRDSLDTLTLEENIGLALTINHADALTVQKKVHDVAIKLGIEDARCFCPPDT